MNQRGFTLLELLVTLVIVAILLAVAAPSFQSVIRNNAMVAARDDILKALQFARAHAVTANTQVSVCAADDNLDDGCSADSRNFANGWIVFEGNELDDADTADNRLRVHEKYENISMIFDGSDTVTYITYQPSGLLERGVGNGLINVCDTTSSGAAPRSVRIALTTGQTRTGDETDAVCNAV